MCGFVEAVFQRFCCRGPVTLAEGAPLHPAGGVKTIIYFITVEINLIEVAVTQRSRNVLV